LTPRGQYNGPSHSRNFFIPLPVPVFCCVYFLFYFCWNLWCVWMEYRERAVVPVAVEWRSKSWINHDLGERTAVHLHPVPRGGDCWLRPPPSTISLRSGNFPILTHHFTRFCCQHLPRYTKKKVFPLTKYRYRYIPVPVHIRCSQADVYQNKFEMVFIASFMN
jgi:hypothetical protein